MPRSPAGLVLAVLALMLCTGTLVPVYTDEIAWRFEKRSALDGVDRMLSDLCGPHTFARPPLFMEPVRWFSAAANLWLDTPLFVRLEGVLCALAWVALVWQLAATLEPRAERRGQLRSLALGVVSLGTLPWLMVMSRPEQVLILVATASVWLALVPMPSLAPARAAWLRAAAIVLLSAFMLSYHLKGVLYAAVPFACILVSARGRGTLLPRLAGLALLAALTLVAARYWTGRFQCPGDPVLKAAYARENVVGLLAAGESPLKVAVQIVKGSVPLIYLKHVVPNPLPMSDWLPRGVFAQALAPVFRYTLLLFWAGGCVAAAFSVGGLLRSVGWRGLFQPRLLIALSILSVLMLWGASQINRNAYEAAHVLPMLAIVLLLCLTLRSDDRPPRSLAVLNRVLVPAAMLGALAVLIPMAGPLLDASHRPGYLDGQPFSVSIAPYGPVRADVERAVALSGMPRHRRLNTLLIDDVTYLALQRSRLPIHRLGVLSIWNGTVTDPAAYLLSRGSDGAVVGCRYLPADMLRVAARSGEVCAVSRAGLLSVRGDGPPDGRRRG